MVPLRTWASLTNSSLSFNGTDYTLTWKFKPVAAFKVAKEKVFIGDEVQYADQSFSPAHLPIVNEEWIGNEQVFYEPGKYTISHEYQDSSGQWSDPYTVVITALVPNRPR